MDFDLNDPLGDILSDDSNDSFFNDDKFDSSDKIKKSRSSNEVKSVFGLSNEASNVLKSSSIDTASDTKKSSSDWLGLLDSKPTTPKLETKNIAVIKTNLAIQTKKEDELESSDKNKEPIKTLSNRLDFLDDVLLSSEKDTKNVKKNTIYDDILEKKAVNKSDDLDSLLAPKKEKSDSTFGYTPSASSKLVIKETFKPMQPKVESELQITSSNMNDKEKNIELPKRNRLTVGSSTKREKSNKDWLGIFSNDADNILDNILDKKDDEKFSNLLKSTTKNDSSIKENFNNIISSKENEKIESKTEDVKDSKIVESKGISRANDEKISEVISTSSDFNRLLSNTLGITGMNNGSQIANLSDTINIEQQSATLCLQQQESHLMVALQLKAQEERLAALQERQEETRKVQNEVVSAHRAQLDKILEGQVGHRNQLQNIIEEHQQRINHYIQLLLRPTSFQYDADKHINKEYIKKQNISDESIDEGNNRNDEIQKSQLEQIVYLLKDSHEKEIELIHSSYSRQLLLANESLLNIEERTKIENEKLIQFYTLRIDYLERQNTNLKQRYEVEIQEIIEKQKIDKDKIEEKHLNDIEILQNQHQIVIDNIKNTLMSEQTILKDAKYYSDKLDFVIEDVGKNNKVCINFMQKLEMFTNNDENLRLKTTQVKEEQINRMLDILDKQKNMYESEMEEKKNLFNIFEDRLKQQMQAIEEEKLALKQKEALLMFDNEKIRMEYENLKKQFELEKQMFKKNTVHIEKTNIEISAEINEKFKKLEEDTQALLEEKKSIAIIKSECNALKMKLESEIHELNNQKMKLKAVQEKMYQDEARILEKSRELETLTRTALAKQKNADNKAAEAAYAKKDYEEKLNQLHEQSLSLNIREQQIAKDKISLSRERLSLYNDRTESEYAVCSICKSTPIPQRPAAYGEEFNAKSDEQIQTINLNLYNHDLLDTFATNQSKKENSLDSLEVMNIRKYDDISPYLKTNDFETDFMDKIYNIFPPRNI